jgi:hemerythrin-like domain-containing protein
MKPRSYQLTPLSSEHRDGMLFVTRMRQALDQVSIERLRKYTLWYWKNHIKPHFYQEEKILLPYMPAEHPWSLKLQDDHAYIRDLILSLDQEADKQSFKSLCDLVDAHIRFEEQQVFTYLEQTLTEDQLNIISIQLEKHPVAAEEWKDMFWKDKQQA